MQAPSVSKPPQFNRNWAKFCRTGGAPPAPAKTRPFAQKAGAPPFLLLTVRPGGEAGRGTGLPGRNDGSDDRTAHDAQNLLAHPAVHGAVIFHLLSRSRQ